MAGPPPCLLGDNPTRLRGRHHVCRCIYAHHHSPAGGNSQGQLPIATAQVQDVLARLRVKPLQHPARQFMHKRAVSPI